MNMLNSDSCPVFHYKGKGKDLSYLPSNPNVGDIYIIKGAVYIWDGTEWTVA